MVEGIGKLRFDDVANRRSLKTQNEKATQQSLGSIGSKLWGQFAKLALPQPLCATILCDVLTDALSYADYMFVWVATVPRENNQKPLVVRCNSSSACAVS